MIFDAGENVEKLAVTLRGVVRAVAGKIGKPQLVSEPEERLVDVLLMRQMVTLKFDVEAAGKNVVEPREVLLSATIPDAAVNKSVRSARKAEQSGGVFLDILAGCEMLALFVPQLDGRDQPREVLIASRDPSASAATGCRQQA